jgi:hypothetical protein
LRPGSSRWPPAASSCSANGRPRWPAPESRRSIAPCEPCGAARGIPPPSSPNRSASGGRPLPVS